MELPPVTKKTEPPTIVPPKPAAPGQLKKPSAPAAPSLPAPFTTCAKDIEEIAKLPRQVTDIVGLQEPKILKRLTENAKAWFEGAPPPTPGNTVIPYIFGRCAFQDMADALKYSIFTRSPDLPNWLVG